MSTAQHLWVKKFIMTVLVCIKAFSCQDNKRKKGIKIYFVYCSSTSSPAGGAMKLQLAIKADGRPEGGVEDVLGSGRGI